MVSMWVLNPLNSTIWCHFSIIWQHTQYTVYMYFTQNMLLHLWSYDEQCTPRMCLPIAPYSTHTHIQCKHCSQSLWMCPVRLRHLKGVKWVSSDSDTETYHSVVCKVGPAPRQEILTSEAINWRPFNTRFTCQKCQCLKCKRLKVRKEGLSWASDSASFEPPRNQTWQIFLYIPKGQALAAVQSLLFLAPAAFTSLPPPTVAEMEAVWFKCQVWSLTKDIWMPLKRQFSSFRASERIQQWCLSWTENPAD